jgi:hypothetical protein
MIKKIFKNCIKRNTIFLIRIIRIIRIIKIENEYDIFLIQL